ncbi:interferon-induced very large GTPase 1-like [Saccostrea cucullata]|uniref:interferon-induced very large GTPase 1-like n=1 Tax=Saccostrea cuccullata TaxID=36930 RepID=UPI002ED67E79
MIQLGGIFEIQIAYIERNNCQATEKRKEFIDRVLMTRHLCKLGCPDVGTVLKSNQEFKEFKLVSTRSYQYGGAYPVVSYPLWKSTLSHCERSWTVVNKEKHENGDYVGVWTLIEHKCESFKNPKKLANFVAAVWTNLVNQNEDRDFCDLIEKWKDSFLKKREAFANESKLPQMDDFLVLLQQLYEGESKFGFMPIQKTMIDCEKYLQPFLRKLMDMKFQGSEEKHQLWHGFLNLANKYGNCRREFVLEISTWLRKHVLSEFVVLPCPFHDIRSTSCAMEEIFLPVVTNILTQEICEEEAFFQFLTSTLQKAVSCALEKLLSSGNTQQYLAMFSNALTLGYDIKTKKIKETLTKSVIQEYSVRCKKSLMLMGAYTSDSSSINQARTLQSIIFQFINKGEKAACFRDIIQTIIKMGLKLDESILNIVCGQTDTGLEIILKRMMQISGISLTYFEGDKSEVYRPLYYEDLVFEHSSSVEQKPLFNILAKMNMTEFYPEKMSLQDVIKMHENQFTEPSSFAELPWAMLGKIIAINFDFREKCLDPFLKRLVVQKMQLCQVAVPLVYWDYEQELFRFSLWPLREIFIDSGSESVATKQMQTLAFIRIGDKRKCSKSKLINQFLRGQNDEHSTFFHKDCLLGHCKRSFANGTIEASWYIPKSNTKNDDSRNPNEKEKKIEQPLTILNLRGDAFSFPEQLHFLTNFANALVLIIDYEDIESEKYLPVLAQIHASEAYVIIITSLPHDDNETEQFIQMYEEKTNLSYEKCSILSTTSEGRHLNEIEVKQFLINDIYDTLHHKIMVSLEEISERLPTDFCCDEELSKSLSGKQLCDEIISKIEGNQWKRELEKRDILPLQGETLWHEWSKEQKEERRSGKQEKINFNEPHLERMRILRMKQICIFEETSDTMARFVQILLTLINDKQTTLFFLSWLRQYMDSRSRTILPCVLNSLRKAFHEFEFIRSQKGGENADENEKKLAQLKETISIKEKKLAHSSFGLEHFFREMGQLFEAFIYCKDDLPCTVTEKTREVIYSLPLIAATLLCWGQPLEVMDGDAANVPLKWIDAVFHEVSKIIGENKRLFAISVLGIQSSGKSTLLNTMFGLQFAVSAGRCTRGIFIQLVPVDKKKSSLKFDYAMVIDTEGLRAPELAGEKVNHDNELATLVIGMGDVAIINIKGETIADMEDVLQIVVHALIRLKQANEKINLKQSCVFVHQNVSAQDADKMTIQGNQKIVNNLDKMTKEVAIEEHVGNIKSFQDVISFNPIKHVKYIPDLWHGTPPMAPASSQYSTSVTELDELKLKWLHDNLRPKIRQCENVEDLENKESTLLITFSKLIDTKTKAIAEELEHFFKESDLSDYMVHWKGRKDTELDTTSRAIITDVRQKLSVEKEKCKALMESNDRILKNQKEIQKLATDFAKTVKGKQKTPSEEEIRMKFKEAWKKWVDDIVKKNPESDVEDDINKMKSDTVDLLYDSQILRIVTDNFQAHYRDSKHGYTLTIPLEITVALHVARFSVYRFSEMIKAFKSKSSLRSRIESSRKETEAYFVGICTAKANESDIESVSWKDESPYKVIMEKLWGCPETCPWCKEPCATTSRFDKHEHFCVQHRPQGVNGIHSEGSEELVLENCNYLIETDMALICGDWCNCPNKDSQIYHPYKDYKNQIPTWDIKPSPELSKYWYWFIKIYGKRLAKLYDLTLPRVPDEWKIIKRKDAISSLSYV